MKAPKSILITGASSGIGAALARLYANPGVTLALGGQNAARLDQVAEACRNLRAVVTTRALDIADPFRTRDWITESDSRNPLDLVIANAGISYGFSTHENLASHLHETFAVNVGGVFNTVHPAIELMQRRGHGQIAIMSSLAGFHGLPSSPAYSTAKATVKAYGEALRGLYKPEGIEVNVICPGFIETPLTAGNSFNMPFLMSAERAAVIIRRGLEANKARIAFPLPMIAMIRLLQLLPENWISHILEQVPHKN
jgi:short-subunit dehydrogenase